MASEATTPDDQASPQEETVMEGAARRLMVAEVALRNAQAELRASNGSNAARKRYADARAELEEADAFAVRMLRLRVD